MMTSPLIFMLISTLIQQVDRMPRHVGRIQAEQAIVRITTDELIASPAWTLVSGDEPPVSVGKAIGLAKQALIDAHPDFKDKMSQVTITMELLEELHSINSDFHYTDKDGNEHFRKGDVITLLSNRSVYWFRFSWIPVVSEGPNMYTYPTIPVAVLMDGKAFVAKPAAQPTK